jgi:hypothetical protein
MQLVCGAASSCCNNDMIEKLEMEMNRLLLQVNKFKTSSDSYDKRQTKVAAAVGLLYVRADVEGR